MNEKTNLIVFVIEGHRKWSSSDRRRRRSGMTEFGPTPAPTLASHSLSDSDHNNISFSLSLPPFFPFPRIQAKTVFHFFVMSVAPPTWPNQIGPPQMICEYFFFCNEAFILLLLLLLLSAYISVYIKRIQKVSYPLKNIHKLIN